MKRSHFTLRRTRGVTVSGMELRSVGNSGLRVSRLGLGTMTWGRDTDEHEARDQIKLFVEAGGTLIDTADVYGDGMAESIVGQLVHEIGTREEMVIATKAGNRRSPAERGRPGARKFDCSRSHLLGTLDRSLQRLGTDYIDLWQVQAWDSSTPIEETLSAIDFAISSGKVRYAGVCNYSGWQTARAATLAQVSSGPLGASGLVSTQVEYSLLQRGIEREVLPAVDALGLGVIAWSPLGRGVLTGKYRRGTPADSRGASPHFGPFVSEFLGEARRRIVEAVAVAADGLGVAPLEVALAWVRDRQHVSSSLVGARTAAQLRGVLVSEELELPEEIRAALDDASEPGRGYPEAGWSQRP